MTIKVTKIEMRIDDDRKRDKYHHQGTFWWGTYVSCSSTTYVIDFAPIDASERWDSTIDQKGKIVV